MAWIGTASFATLIFFASMVVCYAMLKLIAM